MRTSARQVATMAATERLIAWFRIVGGILGIVLTLTDQGLHPPVEKVVEVATMGLLAAVGVGTLRWLAGAPGEAELRRYMAWTYVVDGLALLAQAPLHAFLLLEAPSPAMLVPLLGAVRFGYRGAVPGIVGIVVAYVVRGVIAVRVYGLGAGLDPALVTVLTASIIGLITAHLHREAERGQREADVAAAAAEAARARTAAVHRVLADGVGGGVEMVVQRLAGTVHELLHADRVVLEIQAVGEVAGARAEAGDPGVEDVAVERRVVRYGDVELGALEVHAPRALVAELDDIAGQVGVAVNAARLLDHEAQLSARYRTLDAMRTNFVTLTSHELRTPVTGVIGATETLLARASELSTDRAQQLLELVARQGSRLHRLVEDLTMVGRSDAGVVEYRPVTVAVVDLVASVEIALGRPLTTRGAPTLRVWADADRAVQVLLNLVDNAFEHGDPPVEVAWHELDGAVAITVTDAGEGIAPEDRGRVFERFVQLQSIQHHSRGTGLGLPISRDLARAMGGDVRLLPDSPPTTFELVLPSPDDLVVTDDGVEDRSVVVREP